MKRKFSFHKASLTLGLPLLLVALVLVMALAGGQGADTPILSQDQVQKLTHPGSHAYNYVGEFNNFCDSNPVHMDAAQALGIEPLTDTRSIWQMRRPIVRIGSCDEYHLDELTHSRPFLVPEAASLLDDIGRNFTAQAGPGYQIIVTSVLRTPADVDRLKRQNRNASSNSAHRYGTTFDISYARFLTPGGIQDSPKLEQTLANTLRDLRQQGRLWVVKERKQRCFHVTTRG